METSTATRRHFSQHADSRARSCSSTVDATHNLIAFLYARRTMTASILTLLQCTRITQAPALCTITVQRVRCALVHLPTGTPLGQHSRSPPRCAPAQGEPRQHWPLRTRHAAAPALPRALRRQLRRTCTSTCPPRPACHTASGLLACGTRLRLPNAFLLVPMTDLQESEHHVVFQGQEASEQEHVGLKCISNFELDRPPLLYPHSRDNKFKQSSWLCTRSIVM